MSVRLDKIVLLSHVLAIKLILVLHALTDTAGVALSTPTRNSRYNYLGSAREVTFTAAIHGVLVATECLLSILLVVVESRLKLCACLASGEEVADLSLR